MSVCRVVVIGAGSMGREHIRAFSALENVAVVGLCNRTRERGEAVAAEFGVPLVADSIDELYERTRADLAVIAVPELAANAVAKSCFAHDWSVLMEKPAGYDLADAEDIAASARDRAKPVLVGFNRRFYSSTRAVKSDLASRPGESRFVRVQDQQSFDEARRYRHPEPVVEKFMYANSIHNIDYLTNFCRGNVASVTRLTEWQGAATGVMLVHVAFDSGDHGYYEGLWKGPGPWACSISTPSRRWQLQPLERAYYQNLNERTQNEIEVAVEDRTFKAGFLLQASAAVRRTQGESSDSVTLDESLRTMRLINRMFGV